MASLALVSSFSLLVFELVYVEFTSLVFTLFCLVPVICLLQALDIVALY